MLKSLEIENYALIDKLHIDFEEGFSVITGETGAGKSIILGAIGLLLGQRADVKSIKQGATKCTIEAIFEIASYTLQPFFEANELVYETDCIIRREVQDSGKSRAFINDSPVSLALVKELGEKLIDVHSQHQNMLLSKESFQIGVVDVLAEHPEKLKAYQKEFSYYKGLTKELADLKELAASTQADEAYIRFQYEQLIDAKLTLNEQENLIEESNKLTHSEEIKSGLYKIENLLSNDEGGALEALKESLGLLIQIQKVYPTASAFESRMSGAYIELKDLFQEFVHLQEGISFDPERLTVVTDRLNTIYTLQQKHKVTSVEGLLELKDSFEIKLTNIDQFGEQIEALSKQVATQYDIIFAMALQIREQRKIAAAKIEQQMEERLMALGMPNVRFEVDLQPKSEPDLQGIDGVNFLFSANKNAPLQRIVSVASGGEIARVMLSIKAMIAGVIQLPTILFDEIDTGVSGEMAAKMANIMDEMGRCMQVISITHLPQIASKGSVHYKVYKQDTEIETSSNIRRLTAVERVSEIAHMLSGDTLTEAAINNAKALLNGSN